MSDDIHAIWRIVASNWRSMKADAPEGYEPVTRVHLSGQSDPLPVGRVETHRGSGVTMLDVITTGSGTSGAQPADRFIFVYDRNVAHIEIVYQPIGHTPIAFSVAEGEAAAGSG